MRNLSKLSLYLLISVSFLNLQACRGSDSETLEFEDTAKQETTVVAMFGGFGSCLDGQNRWLGPREQVLGNVFEPAKKAADVTNAKLEKKTPFLLSCYERTKNLRYILSADGEDKGAESEVRTGTLESMASEFEEVLSDQENPVNLVLVGHSWGGWTSMKMASVIDPAHKISALVTLDPIDREKCGPVEVAASLTGFGGQGCRQAPEPMAENDRVVTWKNYYQTNFRPLHSGPATGATENVEKRFNLRTNDVAHHNMFLRDSEVIGSVVSLIQGNANPATGGDKVPTEGGDENQESEDTSVVEDGETSDLVDAAEDADTEEGTDTATDGRVIYRTSWPFIVVRVSW